MSPCSPNDVSLPLPDGPSGPVLPGFGTPFALKVPNISPFPDGFPEDLLDLLNKLQLLIPSGILKPALNPNFGKDVFDAIMKLLDQFFPFLMLYKFFLPLLNLIICVIEVLCAIPNPFKLIRAMRRLFRKCIPAFLNLFPIFALIVMIISLLLLLLALIEYIISQIAKLIKAILRNLNALVKSFQDNDSNSVLAIANKLGSLLCIFQNLFVLLALFNIIIGVIRDMLSLTFHIPPCDNSNPNDLDGCCTPDVCPTIALSSYTRTTGTFQYLNQVSTQTSLVLPGFGNFNVSVRNESWQIFDGYQQLAQEFINIVDGYDIPFTPKPVFFPTDVVYSSQTSPKQAAYTVDLRLFYNPVNWGRTGIPRHIRFKDCIVIKAPTRDLTVFDNSTTNINNGVIILAGGLGYEDDGTTVLRGFSSDGHTQISSQATLENFIHRAARVSTNPILFPSDGYTFNEVEYTFVPHFDTLLTKNLVTLGCEPSLALNRVFVNDAFAGDVGLKAALLGDIINGRNGRVFPDTQAAQDCLSTALAALRGNMTTAGVAQFQATTDICMSKLRSDTNSALNDLIGVGFDPCSSNFTATPTTQFTSKPIIISVDLKEKNGISLTTGLPTEIANSLASKLKAHITFGKVTNFSYDGYQFYTAELSSQSTGNGQLMVSFDNNIFCTNIIPEDNAIDPTHTLKTVDYNFIYTPSSAFSPGSAGTGVGAGVGDSDGQPRRDEGDLVRDSKDGA